ncbi:hypothetical protein BDY21DRAFT_367445 [Lineolata rhizophorae]|uniref:CNNM transmembrane domain-containing protein n=1 Tax=Lineolata rhizophorae TaxID=578093 RepID=A0A6A6NNF4_9PEZI|nr:hypothetical protein BDY21DRAFT_367445 [Lineolata rhizophorae]
MSSVGAPGMGRQALTTGWASSFKLSVHALIIAFSFRHAAAAPAGYLSPSSFGPLAEGESAGSPGFWAYLGTAIALVLLGGAFAGLTIALMGQDEIYLQVLADSGEGSERKDAKKVLKLLKRGKHWVLVTLLLSNVITNETLPLVLDRSLGGGVAAAVSSTVLIVIFGEIVPQSVCVRFGLPIGAWMSPFVFALMVVMAPVAWPTAKLLDWLLGDDHGTVYKKAGLKTLVTLHKTLGQHPHERLNQDEVTIITAVLDLKAKPVGSIMTPMADVFTLDADTVLDEKMVSKLLDTGYSRVPIHAPDNKMNFIGMLLVKMLIAYDPEDKLRVRDFALATLPETRPETSCLDIINFFQEGKSHMILVSDYPGEPFGAIGVVTLEDVIEELIGEEIVDESDVFVDVHKAVRRLQPAPRFRMPKGVITKTAPTAHLPPHPDGRSAKSTEGQIGPKDAVPRKGSPLGTMPAGVHADLGKSPKTTTLMMRRRSSGNGTVVVDPAAHPVPIRSDDPNVMANLRSLGPSNVATRPKGTRITSVKIKPGVGSGTLAGQSSPIAPKQVDDINRPKPAGRSASVAAPTAEETTPLRPSSSRTDISAPLSGSVGEGVLRNAGRDASDAAQTVQQGYGTMGGASGEASASSWRKPARPLGTIKTANGSPVAEREGGDEQEGDGDDANETDGLLGSNRIYRDSSGGLHVEETASGKIIISSPHPGTPLGDQNSPPRLESTHSSLGGKYAVHSDSSGSDTALRPPSQPWTRGAHARSGSIHESSVELAGGVRKLVLEAGDTESDEGGSAGSEEAEHAQHDAEETREGIVGKIKGLTGKERKKAKKKERRKRGRKHKNTGPKDEDTESGELAPLLSS